MSTPIFKLLLAAGAFALAACDDGFNVTRSAPERIQLSDGLVVQGTRGWCVDTRTTRTDGATSVVVLGSCAAISGNAFLPRPAVPGVVTVSVENAAGAVPPMDVLKSYVASDVGRATLARDGSAGSVEILESRQTDELLLIHVDDASRREIPGVASDYWRALFGLDGRFVTVSLVGLSTQPIGSRAGFEALREQAARIVAANGG